MDGRAKGDCGLHTATNLDCLDGLQRHYGCGELGVEAFIPVGISSKSGRHMVADHLEDSSQ